MPSDLMAKLHNRMPVILQPEHFDWRMTGQTEEAGQLLVPCPSEKNALWVHTSVIYR
jgi:putative SOS response-associated peptidase YedK